MIFLLNDAEKYYLEYAIDSHGIIHVQNINKKLMQYYRVENTIFYLAIQNNYSKNKIRFLLKHGADVNIQNFEGNTPLHLATNLSVSESIVKLLIKYGANILLKNNATKTTFEIVKADIITHSLYPVSNKTREILFTTAKKKFILLMTTLLEEIWELKVENYHENCFQSDCVLYSEKYLKMLFN